MAKTSSGPKGYLAVFATILVVAGVAAVAFVAAPRKSVQTPASPQAPATSTASGPTLLIVDDAGARFLIGGTERPAKWPDDTEILGTPLSTLVGRDVSTGAPAYLLPEFVRATSSAGIRSPDGRRSLHSAPARRDGSGAVEVRYGNDSQEYVLRFGNNRAIKDVNPIGWWDRETVAATGFVTSSRILFSVSLSGEVKQVAILPDTINLVRAENGSVWYIEVQPGEGLESDSHPPSTLHRVSRDGTDDPVAEESDRIILQYIVASDGRIAYQTDDGNASVLTSDGERVSRVKGMPLGFLPDGRILVARGTVLAAADPSDGFETRIADAPGEGSAVFLLPPPKVDATPEIK